jgi:hypothetical protein
MTPLEIYREAEKRGLRLEPAGDKLAVFPKGACPPDFAEVLRENKPVLLEWLSNPPSPGWQAVPPTDLPLRSGKPDPSPSARNLVLEYLLRQGCDRPGPLTAWLVCRECAYYDGPGYNWDCCSFSYAAARDAACWQLNRTESEVWELLAEFERISPRKSA